MAIGRTINRCEIEGRVKWRVASASHGRDDGAPIYGWTGAQTVCDPVTGLADSGDPYYCLTGVASAGMWK